MHDGLLQKLIFFFYLSVSAFLSFLIPSGKTLRFKYFIKYLYYTPYEKSASAFINLTELPGRFLSIAKLDRCLNESRREALEKDFKIKMLEEEILRRQSFDSFILDPFYLENKPVSTVVYGELGENSSVLLLKNRGFKQGAAVVSREGDFWVLIGSIKNVLSEDIAVCALTTNRASRVSVSGAPLAAGGEFWAVMTGKSDGEGMLDFIWPSRNIRIEKGQELLTSGWDGRFPPGLLCGKVRKITQNRAGEKFVRVKVAYNANSLKHIFVLKQPKK
ncbi:MAG: hypothetical protein COT16_03485 [Elusimicrobia bacterium CG08_land_8_20_14_0_20_44_26]|nr:MAG: hypothetical protein COT16_03485 [Elusimicrobia bacterium CG08_land_8_20_14_0_20_44_26]